MITTGPVPLLFKQQTAGVNGTAVTDDALFRIDGPIEGSHLNPGPPVLKNLQALPTGSLRTKDTPIISLPGPNGRAIFIGWPLLPDGPSDAMTGTLPITRARPARSRCRGQDLEISLRLHPARSLKDQRLFFRDSDHRSCICNRPIQIAKFWYSSPTNS